MNVRFDHAENQGILNYLGKRRHKRHASIDKAEISFSPDTFKDPYMQFGAHPDLVSHFWDDITQDIPEECAWFVYDTHVLVHPVSGIVFGYCGGTHTYAFRLPANIHAGAIERGAETVRKHSSGCLGIGASKEDLTKIGADWVFGRFFDEEKVWCVHAYTYAGELGKVDGDAGK